MNAYERLCAARAKGRPTAASYISALFTDFFEMCIRDSSLAMAQRRQSSLSGARMPVF